jgi:DNA-binding NarL/FixJ family response regulator
MEYTGKSKKLKKVIIVDDHEIFADGIKLILESNLASVSCDLIPSAKGAMEYFQSGGEADLVLLDLHMPEMNGFEFLEQTQNTLPNTNILVISMQYSFSNVVLSKKLGAKGFVRKDSSLKVMLKAVERTIQGKEFFPEEIKVPEEVVDNALDGICKEYKLTKSEIKILNKLLEQKNYKEIATEMNLSPETVRTHRKNIYRKTGVRNLAGIVGLLKEELERG